MAHGEVIYGHIGEFRRKFYGGISDTDAKMVQNKVERGTSCDRNQVLVFGDDYIWSTFCFKQRDSAVASDYMHSVYVENDLNNLLAFEDLLYFPFENALECDDILGDRISFDEHRWSSLIDRSRIDFSTKVIFHPDLLAQLACYCCSKVRNYGKKFLCILVPEAEVDYIGYCRNVIYQILKVIPAGLRSGFSFSINSTPSDEGSYGILFRRDDGENIPHSVRINKNYDDKFLANDPGYLLPDIRSLIEQCVYEESMRVDLSLFEIEHRQKSTACGEEEYCEFFYSKNTVDILIRKLVKLIPDERNKLVDWKIKLINSKNITELENILYIVPQRYRFMIIAIYCNDLLNMQKMVGMKEDDLKCLDECFNVALRFCVCDKLSLELRIRFFLWRYADLGITGPAKAADDTIEVKIERICNWLTTLFHEGIYKLQQKNRSLSGIMKNIYHDFLASIGNRNNYPSLNDILSKFSESYEENLVPCLLYELRIDKTPERIEKIFNLKNEEIKSDKLRNDFISSFASEMKSYINSSKLSNEKINSLLQILEKYLLSQSEILHILKDKQRQGAKKEENMSSCDSLGRYIAFCGEDATLRGSESRREAIRKSVWKKLHDMPQPLEIFRYNLNRARYDNRQDEEELCAEEYKNFIRLFKMGIKINNSCVLEYLYDLLTSYKRFESDIWLWFPQVKKKQYTHSDNKVRVDDIIACIDLVIRSSEGDVENILSISDAMFRILGNLNMHGLIPPNVAENWAASGNSTLVKIVSGGKNKTGSKIKRLFKRINWKTPMHICMGVVIGVLIMSAIYMAFVRPQNPTVDTPEDTDFSTHGAIVEFPSPINPSASLTPARPSASPTPASPSPSPTSDHPSYSPNGSDESLDRTADITSAAELWATEHYTEAYAIFKEINNDILGSQMISTDVSLEVAQTLREFFAMQVFLSFDGNGMNRILDNIDFYSMLSVHDIDSHLKSDMPVMLMRYVENDSTYYSVYYWDGDEAGYISFEKNLTNNHPLLLKMTSSQRISPTKTANVKAAMDEVANTETNEQQYD